MFPWHDVCRSPASRLVELPAPVPPRPSVGTGARDGGLGALRMPGRDGGAGTRPPVGPVPGGRVPVDLAAASAPGRRRLIKDEPRWRRLNASNPSCGARLSLTPCCLCCCPSFPLPSRQCLCSLSIPCRTLLPECFHAFTPNASLMIMVCSVTAAQNGPDR